MSGQGLPDEALAHACKGEDDEDPALDEDGRQRLLVAHLQQQTYCPLPASCDSSAALAESVSKVVRPHRMLGILKSMYVQCAHQESIQVLSCTECIL